MTIHLPDDLESSIQAAVHDGRFATFDDAMTEAARSLLREISRGQPNAAAMGSIGAMREAADGPGEIVAGAMTQRRAELLRENPATVIGCRCVSYQPR